MAPKAKAPPKRTEADVIAEYEQIRREFDERAVEINARLEKASQALMATRLDYVAARDNKVFLEAKLLAEKMSADELAAAAAAASNEVNQDAKQTKRIIKDNQFELSYATQTSQSLEKELEAFIAQLQDLENMRTTNIGQMEIEMDRLAQSTSAFVSKSHKLQRTIAAIEATHVQHGERANEDGSSEVRCPLQLTLLCGTDTGIAVDGSALNPRCVVSRVEDVLTRRCGFQVFAKVVPEPSIVSSLLVAPQTERDVQRRVAGALWSVSQHFSSPSITPLVVVHCPTWTQFSSETGISGRIMLRFSNVSDEVGRFLGECGQPGRREFFDIGLDHVLSMLVSRSRNPNLMVLVDTWPAEAHPDASPFALIFSKSVSDTPSIFLYGKSGSAVDSVHLQGGALQRVTRGVLLEEFVAIVAACSSPSQLDCHTVTSGLVTLMSSRHSAFTVQPLLPAAAIGTPFASLFLPVDKLKELHHHVPASQKPFPSPSPLHFEMRRPLPPEGLHLVAPSSLKWKHLVDSSLSYRGSSDATRFPLRTHVTSDLLRLHVKKEANVPHSAFELDIAVEDDSYHVRPSIEDDGIEWAQIISRRLYSACVTIDESYVMEQRLNQCASVPIAIGQESWSGSSFSVAVAPPPCNNSNTQNNEIWHIDGVRLASEKILRVEVALVLDVKKGAPQGPTADAYENVTAALDPLAHSIKRKLQELLEELDRNRRQGALRIVYSVDVWRISPRDNDHFRGSVSVGVVVHEREAAVPHIVHVRQSLIKLLKRYPPKPQEGWIPCAEQTTLPQPTSSVFRVARLFHVLRSWRCAVHLHPDTPFHLQSPRCEYLGHLLRRIVVVHAGIGGPSGTTPLMRLIDVRSVQPDPEDHNASFGPHLLLNEVSEEHLASAISAAWGHPLNQVEGAANVSSVVSSPARSLAAAFGARPSAHKTLCVLCWCFPKPTAASVHAGAKAMNVLPLYIHSAMHAFHNKLRPTAVVDDVACLVTCGYSYERRERSATDDPVDFKALEASLLNALAHSAPPAASDVAIRRLPLDELAPNKDEDTGDATAGEGETNADEDAPYAEDETYRPLENACLMKKSVHAYNPVRSLFPLPLSFWNRVRDACEGRLAAVPESTAGVSLVAAVLKEDGSAAVHTLTDALEQVEGDDARDVIPPALRPQEIERFVQSMLRLREGENESAPKSEL